MFKNYLKVALRDLRKGKLYSFINIAGLSIGIASCLLIFLYLQQELSYDRYNEKAGRIYRLTEVLHLPKEENRRALTSPPMAPKLKAAFPEVQNTVRITFSDRILSYQQKKSNDTRILVADSTFFDIFTFPMLRGNPRTALVNPYSVVLTESTAKKYFGNDRALGKTMQLSDTIPVIVTGIMKDVPSNSHFTFDCALSRTSLFEMTHHRPEDGWFNNNSYTYVLLPENYRYHELETKMSVYLQKELAEQRKSTGLWYDLKLQPITDIHLRSNLNWEMGSNSDISYIYIFASAAILILLIACSNFVNLSTAKSLNRSIEIGLRKVMGAKRSQLIEQFLGESFLFALLAGILACGWVTLALPLFNSFTGKSLSFNIFNNAVLLLIYGSLIGFVGLLAGIYPALLMSSSTPVKSLKGNLRYGWQDIFLRKGLVVFQFSIAIILIIGTTLVLEQLRYVQKKNIGLNKDQLLEIPINNKDLSKTASLLKDIRAHTGVIQVALTDFSFKEVTNSIAVLPDGATSNEVNSQSVISVDENFLPTFQISLSAGRNFSKSFATDPNEAFIVNETAVKAFGWNSPQLAIGKNMDWGPGKKGKVIGVVKDFNFASLHDNIKPLIIHILPDWYGFVAVRVKPEELQSTLKELESSWKNIASNSPFRYTFINDDFANLYKAEQNMQSVLTSFTSLSLFIACMGLFGLATFSIRQRTKEIGVRKVLGASVTGITGLLSKDFLKLVLMAIIIASPLAWFGVERWLQQFAYRIEISYWIFFIAAFAAILIALTTVSFLALKAAFANPVKSLRTEV